jgi:acetyl-CoA decarbonylase/synthase complex subunit gamma
MALTGIQIFKLLPKTNCKECGVPTCLAFAMNLASGKAELGQLPLRVRRSPRKNWPKPRHRRFARWSWAKASAKPPPAVKPSSIVMKKPFSTPPCWPPRSVGHCRRLAAKLKGGTRFSSSGWASTCAPNWWPLKDVNGDAAAFAAVAKQVAETSEFNVVLMSENVDVMKAGVEACRLQAPPDLRRHGRQRRCLGRLAKDNDLPLAVKADSVEALVPLTDKLTGMGLKDLVLDPGSPGTQAGPGKIRWPFAARP